MFRVPESSAVVSETKHQDITLLISIQQYTAKKESKIHVRSSQAVHLSVEVFALRHWCDFAHLMSYPKHVKIKSRSGRESRNKVVQPASGWGTIHKCCQDQALNHIESQEITRFARILSNRVQNSGFSPVISELKEKERCCHVCSKAWTKRDKTECFLLCLSLFYIPLHLLTLKIKLFSVVYAVYCNASVGMLMENVAAFWSRKIFVQSCNYSSRTSRTIKNQTWHMFPSSNEAIRAYCQRCTLQHVSPCRAHHYHLLPLQTGLEVKGYFSHQPTMLRCIRAKNWRFSDVTLENSVWEFRSQIGQLEYKYI